MFTIFTLEHGLWLAVTIVVLVILIAARRGQLTAQPRDWYVIETRYCTTLELAKGMLDGDPGVGFDFYMDKFKLKAKVNGPPMTLFETPDGNVIRYSVEVFEDFHAARLAFRNAARLTAFSVGYEKLLLLRTVTPYRALAGVVPPKLSYRDRDATVLLRHPKFGHTTPAAS